MELKLADLSDVEGTLALHYKYQVDSISEEDKNDGFVTTAFSKDELIQLIEQEQGLFIAKQDGKVVAYVMAASWQFWSKWPMFAHMIKDLSSLTYQGYRLTVDNSYQYGPICIDKSKRGQGVLQQIFEFALAQMSTRYPVLVTFVNKANGRSFVAHQKKLGLDTLQEFEYNNNHYYEMACLTKRVN